MTSRYLTLLIFRALLIVFMLGYQVLALILPFPRLPFDAVLIVTLCQTVLNLLYAGCMARREPPANFVFLQLAMDILLVSVLVVLTGGILSNIKFAYVLFILLSALFLERIAIYAITTLSLATYFFALHLTQFLYQDFNNGSTWDWSEQIGWATAAQFVLCFLAAFVASFMQGAYRRSRLSLRQKELQIHHLREIRRKIVESLPSGLMMCDLDGHVSYMNQIGRRLLNVGMDAEVGTFHAWGLLGMNPPPMGSGLQLTRAERTLNIGGTRRILGISYTALNPETGETGYLIVFQDLTKIKMMEASNSLNERMIAIGKMAAGVAHEIRNPLAAISGSVQVLKELTPDDEVSQELAGIVEKETLRLNDIISQFMAYARPGLPPMFLSVDLAALVKTFYQLAINDYRFKQLKVTCQITPGDLLILGDEARLTQVFWNLASNSYIACESGGSITIGCFPEEDEVVFFLEDDGKGMTDEEVREIFTPFQSFSKSGTGLGMSIVYDIIKLHHATIKVASEPGKGTRIEIHFAKHKE